MRRATVLRLDHAVPRPVGPWLLLISPRGAEFGFASDHQMPETDHRLPAHGAIGPSLMNPHGLQCDREGQRSHTFKILQAHLITSRICDRTLPRLGHISPFVSAMA